MVRPKVNVIGWFNKTNAGDESYKLAFPLLFDNIDLRFSSSPNENVDAYILGGGDIVSPSFLEPLFKINKPKYLLSVSIPEKVNKNLLSQFKKIIVRDRQSLENLNRLGFEGVYLPDFAFALQPNVRRGKMLIEEIFARENTEKYERVTGVVVNSHLLPRQTTNIIDASRFEYLAHELAWVADNVNSSFLFIPFCKMMPWDDRCSACSVITKCKFWAKNTVAYENLSAQETLDIIAGLDCLISTRLHSTIFSIISATPFIDITHNHKNKNLLQTLDYEKVSIPYGRINAENIRNKIEEINDQKSLVQTEIKNMADNQKQLLAGVVNHVHFI